MKKLLVLGVLLVLALPALAGVRYSMRVETNDAGTHSEFIQNSWLQGDRAKLTFDNGINTTSEIYAQHFGTIAYDADPNTRQTKRITLHAPDRNLPIVIENIVTRMTNQEPGPIVLGHPTTHYSFASEFDYNENGFTQKGTMMHDVWVANDLADFDTMSWMLFEFRLRRDRGIESIFRQVATLGRGLPLAYDGVALIKTAEGNTHVVRIGAKVDSIEKVNVDPSVFSASSNIYEVVAGGK
ncbi:MAG TPA: hypothetical protein VGL89_13640 [Candidatus Koribacter sp.]